MDEQAAWLERLVHDLDPPPDHLVPRLLALLALERDLP